MEKTTGIENNYSDDSDGDDGDGTGGTILRGKSTSLIPKALLREAIKKPETLYDLVGYISKEVFYLTFPFTFMHSSLTHKLDTKDLEIIANPLKMSTKKTDFPL
ncbi:hypothetical protein HZH68_002495 [Vespula germanica]|uniref:Uncharacterized protein n=1 Tax=Vespula germanica TaxID=30212 RepID=A0A834NME0_VESGE|nr:hypothetical protein HZH68_002495 [Vespula germanica]